MVPMLKGSCRGKFHTRQQLPTQCSLDARAVCVTAGAIALNGDLPAVVDWVRGSVLVYPARAAIAGPLLYHYIGGLRHIAWDHAKCVRPSACPPCRNIPPTAQDALPARVSADTLPITSPAQLIAGTGAGMLSSLHNGCLKYM